MIYTAQNTVYDPNNPPPLVLTPEDFERIEKEKEIKGFVSAVSLGLCDDLGENNVRASRWIPHTPHPRQKLFLDLMAREAFYGGAAGGGKTDALLMAALEYVDVPGYSALLIMRTFADLIKPKALIDRSQEWLRGTGADWSEQKKTWTFPSGARLSFGYLQNEQDKHKYRSAEYQFIGLDELTRFALTQYTYMFTRLRRLLGVEIPLRVRSASNPAKPGEPGMLWVKERFVPDDFTPSDADEPCVLTKEGVNAKGDKVTRIFVPARVDDNPSLDKEEYVESLSETDPVTLQQMLMGDWTIQERGNIYPMWDERYHVITWEEFEKVFGTPHIPLHWLLAVFEDNGTTEDHPNTTSWFATAPENAPIVNGVRMAGSVFLYRGRCVWGDWSIRDLAEDTKRQMGRHHEFERTRIWKNSHEGNSERIAYNRDYGLPFSAWEPSRTRGIAQVRDALEIVDKDKDYPFGRNLKGHPQLYLVVPKHQLLRPDGDEGLARWRAEFMAYHYATQKNGEPLKQLQPHPLFNDAMDTVREAGADYFPPMKKRTRAQKIEEAMPEHLRQENIIKTDAEEQGMLWQSRRLQLAQVVKNLDANKYTSPVSRLHNQLRRARRQN